MRRNDQELSLAVAGAQYTPGLVPPLELDSNAVSAIEAMGSPTSFEYPASMVGTRNGTQRLPSEI